MPRFLILTAGTGSGHNMRARALAAWLRRAGIQEQDILVHPTLERTHGLYRFGVDFYNWIQRRAPWMHHTYFHFLELASLHRRPEAMLGADAFRALVRRFRPDVVVSVHAHTNHGFFALARQARGADNVRCVTYCGELSGGYGFSRHWVNREADLFVGAVDETCEAAIRRGMPEARVRTGGFLLRPAFYEAPRANEADVLEAHGLDPSAFTLMLTTGDAGANNHLRFINALERARLEVQVIALCGRDQRVLEAVRRRAETARHVNVVPLAYTEDMAALLRSASAVVARPGSGTTSEAIRCACPLVHNGTGTLMPQELATYRFCRRRGLSVLIHRPAGLASVLRRWRADPEEPERLRERLRRAGPEQTPADILSLLGVEAARRSEAHASTITDSAAGSHA